MQQLFYIHITEILLNTGASCEENYFERSVREMEIKGGDEDLFEIPHCSFACPFALLRALAKDMVRNDTSLPSVQPPRMCLNDRGNSVARWKELSS